MFARLLLLLVCACAISPAAPVAAAVGESSDLDGAWRGPNPDPHFDHLGRDDGLSQISVNDLLQDRHGWIWIATQDGIQRFDGYEFEVFQHDPDDPGSPATSLVQDLFLDSRGRIWAMPSQGGVLQYFDPRAQRFFSFHHNPADPASPRPTAVARRAVYEDALGRLWLGTPLGLQIVDPESRRVWRIAAPHPAAAAVLTLLEDRDGVLWLGTATGLLRLQQPAEQIRFGADLAVDVVLPNRRITSLLQSRSGNLWVATGTAGLYRYDPRSRQVLRHSVPTELAATGPWNNIGGGTLEHPLAEDRLGRLWICTNAGLLRYEPLTDQFRAWPADPPGSQAALDRRSPSNSLLADLLEDHLGRFWVATTGGLYLHQPESDDFQRYAHHPAEPRGLGNNLLSVLYEDHSGNLWIGTQGAGISRLSPYKNQFRLLHHRPSHPEGLQDSKVFSVLVDAAGTLWVGTSEAGLYRFDATRRHVIEHYGTRPGTGRNLLSNFVRALLEDRDGRLWVGTVGSGISVIDRGAGQVVRRYFASPGGLVSNNIFSLTQSQDGAIWIGTNGGVQRWDPETETFLTWTNNPADGNSLPANFVRFTFEDSHQRLWFGTAAGLARYHPASAGTNSDGGPNMAAGSFSRYQHRVGDPSSLSHDILMAMHEDREGRLWVVTHGGGLDLFDPDSGIFRPYRKRDGLPTDTLYAILEDDDGHLWLSTNAGLSRFEPDTGKFTNYGSQHGLGGEEFNGRAAWRTPAGELLFGGIHGLNYFHPRHLRSNPHPPPVRLTNFYRLDQRQRLSTDPAQLSDLEVGYRENFFAFEFTALDFTSPQHNRYAYQLIGFDHDWIDAGTRRYASYTNLDGGDYVFRVQASNSDGVWSPQAASIRVRVIPPPWRTWWAYAGYLLLSGTGVLGYVRHRVASQEAALRDRQHELERRALAAEHQRQAEELERARDLQLSMLPPAPPRLPGLEIATFMRTATEVGGDYYDFFPQEDGSLFAVTGDATGHGLSAGMMVSMTKAALKALAVRSPSALLRELNGVLRTMELKRLRMALNVLHLEGHRVTLSSAGMPPVLHCRPAGSDPVPIEEPATEEPATEEPATEESTVEELLLPGLPLGSRLDENYRESTFQLQPRDVLVLYSDGLPEWIEERTGEPGYEAVVRCLQGIADGGAQQVLDALLRAGGIAPGERAPRDDITLVVICATKPALGA